MLFNYPEINTIEEFNLRWYLVSPDEAYPSITSMLSRTQSGEFIESLNNWRDSIGHEEADRISSEAATNGSAVHLLIERHLKNEDLQIDEFTDFQVKSFKSLKLYLKKINPVWGQEVALFSRRLKIAGRCDCIGVYNGVPSIIDFKTSSKIKNEALIEDYKYQLAFYAAAHNEMFNTNITNGVIIMSTKNGFPLEFTVNLDKYFIMLENRISNFYDILFKGI